MSEQTLTPEQREAWLAEVKRAASEGRSPQPMPWAPVGPRRPEVVQPQPASSDIFSSADLTLDLIGKAHEYQVPGTNKRLWIFPVTFEDTEFMLSWSLLPDSLSPDPSDPHRAQVAQARLIQDLKLAQVARCTRTGPTRESRPCFDRRDLPAIRSRLGSSIVEEIVRISNELSGNEEALGGSTRRFFAVIRAFLLTLPSPSATSANSPFGYADTHTRLLSLVTRALSRGKLDGGIMSDLEDVEMGL